MIRKIILVIFVFVMSKATFAIDKQMFSNLKQHNKLPKTQGEYRYYRNISNIVDYTCRVYRIPKRLFMAILMRESQYQVGAIGTTNGEPTDFGIGQIYWKTMRAYRFKEKRLLTDRVYSVRAGAIVLRDFKKMYRGREKRWYLRYNTSNKEKQKVYYADISRYF